MFGSYVTNHYPLETLGYGAQVARLVFSRRGTANMSKIPSTHGIILHILTNNIRYIINLR